MTVLPTDTPKHPFAVLHVPHASVTIPTADRASIHLSDDELALELRRMTDRYTDELFDLDPAIASAVSFPISRLVVDPERFLDDAFEPMAARGMGVLYTTTSHGAVLRTPPVRAERQRLIDQYYAPHHDLLTTTVDAAVHAWHSCLVIDCHSFPAAALPYELDQTGERAEICLGTDSFHTPQALIDSARNIFEEAGFTVCVDRPFSGALVPAAHYGRDPRVMAIMVEVNRGIYMDEQTGERLPGFSEIRARVQAAVRGVIDECAGSL